MSTKNAILQMKLESAIQDLMVRTNSTNVIVNVETGETLATRLASIADTFEGEVTKDEVSQMISDAIDGLIDGAPDTFDTLKEIADWINSDESAMSALQDAIVNKVDKEDGMGLSANDFTDALKEKLESLTLVQASEINGNIIIDGQEVTVYTPEGGEGNESLPEGGEVGQVLRALGEGKGEWGVNVRSGISTPDDLAEGEYFIKLIEDEDEEENP